MSNITVKWDSYTTFICSSLSILGSVIVLCSYMVAQSSVTPRAAQLIRNLAIADFFWFLAAVIQSVYWVFTDVTVPSGMCYFFSPIVNFMRMASLIWTCAISFDVLMSVNKRKWLWVSDKDNWTFYRRLYYCTVLVFALPGTILNIIKQHSGDGDQDLGCNPGYEKIGEWYDVFFTELLPISIGFLANIYVYIQVREKMSQKAFPQSVRKRRRRIMYHYIIVCIICWTPTMVFYLSEIAGFHSSALEIIARSSLYCTGFFNFLVFGMQDPHLKRAFVVFAQKMGCLCWCCCCIIGESDGSGLKTREVDKTVMFGGHIEDNADVSKDKKNIYRYHKLTTEDKLVLYHNRPDLDPNVKIGRKKKDEERIGKSSGNSTPHSRKKNRSIDFTSVKGMHDDDDDDEEDMGLDSNDDNGLKRCLLTKEEKRDCDAYDSVDSFQSSESSTQVENVLILASAQVHGNTVDQGRELDSLPVVSPERQARGSKEQPAVISYDVTNNDHILSPSRLHDDSRHSDILIADVQNPTVAHVRMGSTSSQDGATQFAAGGSRRASSEDRINAARARMKQLRLGSDGPLISDEESFARSMDHIADARNGSVSGSMSRTSTQNGEESDSSGDEADEEDHALAEKLDIALPISVATSNLLGSP